MESIVIRHEWWDFLLCGPSATTQDCSICPACCFFAGFSSSSGAWLCLNQRTSAAVFCNFLFLRQILQVLVRAVVENLTDSHGEQAGTMHSKLKELLGRVSSRHSSDAHVWQLYARLYGDGRSSNLQDDEKVHFLS